MNRSLLPIACALLGLPCISQAASMAIDLPGFSIPVEAANNAPGAMLTLTGPDGLAVQRTLTAADGGRFQLSNVVPRDGQYRYRIDVVPGALVTRTDVEANSRALNASQSSAALAPSEGTFRISNGQLFVPPPPSRYATGSVAPPKSVASSNPPAQPQAQVITEDLIVQSNACVGLDCESDEIFGFETLRLKEQVMSIRFIDTSTSPDATHDWELTANRPGSGGAEQFSISDLTAFKTPFTLSGGAPDYAFFMDATGKIGLHTSTPMKDLHLNTSDSPTLRLEQNTNDSYPAQTWDIGGNETGFFVSDVTHGSNMPFRIRSGAPVYSLSISSNGYVGFGTNAPSANVDVRRNAALTNPVPALKVSNFDPSVTSGSDRFVVDSSGNVLARGTISQLSSRTAKRDFRATDGRVLLAKLEKMPIETWRYKGSSADERHLGPVAEDFHAAFGLGKSNRYIAPTDMAGVALASVKALQQQIKERDERIARLEGQLQVLAQRLDELAD
jgi:hypothetical protein